MIAYITLGTNDLDRAGKFYDALLGECGAGRVMESERITAWATGPGQPMVAVIKPFDEAPATVGNGTMISIGAENPAAVDRLHAKALELGGGDEGAVDNEGSEHMTYSPSHTIFSKRLYIIHLYSRKHYKQ